MFGLIIDGKQENSLKDIIGVISNCALRTKVRNERLTSQKNITEEQRKETGQLEYDFVTAWCNNTWFIGDRVEATRDYLYDDGNRAMVGDGGTLIRLEMDRKEFCGIKWDSHPTFIRACKLADLIKRPLRVMLGNAKNFNYRWPSMRHYDDDDRIEVTKFSNEGYLPLKMVPGYEEDTIALENYNKSGHYIGLPSDQHSYLRFIDYSDKPIDEAVSFCPKPVPGDKSKMRLETCNKKRYYVGVCVPGSAMVSPYLQVYSNDMSQAFKDASNLVITGLGESDRVRVTRVNLFWIGGLNIGVRWYPNVGKVQIYWQQERSWIKGEICGSRDTPSAAVFTLPFEGQTRVCVFPNELRHLAKDALPRKEWARLGGVTSEWVDVKGFPKEQDDDATSVSGTSGVSRISSFDGRSRKSRDSKKKKKKKSKKDSKSEGISKTSSRQDIPVTPQLDALPNINLRPRGR